MNARGLLGSLALLVAAGGVAGCGGGVTTVLPGSGSGADDRLPGRTYLSTDVTDEGAPRQLVDGTRISLGFTDDGRVLAQAGCNSMSGQATIDDGRIDVDGGLATTEMGCDPARHDQDEWLAKVLASGPEWRLDGHQLTLTSGDTKLVLLDRKVAQPDRPLEGTRWKLTSIIDGEAASSVPKLEKTPYVEFADNGEVKGFDGCNGVGGTAKVEGSTIEFGSLMGTLIACPGDAGEVETTVLDVLKGKVRFAIDADQLRLKHPDGKGLVFTAAPGAGKDR
ncbi:MAG: META domain-containing protein [Actinopolymorphaceae bacterium]